MKRSGIRGRRCAATGSPASARHCKRRRGFTLTELLMASACTVGISAAGVTMATAVSYALSAATTDAATTVVGHGAIQRAARLVRQARLIGYNTATEAALWTVDTNKDDQTQLSEAALLWYDATSQQLRWTTPFSSSMSAAAIAAADRVVSFSELSSATFPASIQAATNAQTTVMAENATGFQISANASNTSTGLLSLRLLLNGSQGTVAFDSAVSPRAPADYLTATGLRTNDGVATLRFRRLGTKVWAVPP